ncbi:MAG: HAMP domain-containing protein [Chloroflexi bacterium]|nr:HAMP domain-containing protein [Chloroflexota bacterium]
MSRISRLLAWRSLRTRIALALVGLTLALGVVALVQASLDLTNILQERLSNRGTAIAKDLAARSAAPSQTNDVFGLYEVVNDSLLNNADVRYIFLVEPSHEVRVQTFEQGVPPGLAEANPWTPGQRESIRTLQTSEGPILDIAVPVLGGQGGVIRVGMSEAGVRKRVTSYILRLAGLVCLAVLGAVALSFLISSLLTRPLTRVAEAARKVGSGDLTTRVPVEPGSELGDLARAFNLMTEDLRVSRQDLVQRNAELEILNSMADTLSRQLSQQQVFQTSLERLLDLTSFSAAWVCTKGPDEKMTLVAHRGLPPVTSQQDKAGTDCRCLELFSIGRPGAIHSLPSCPLVALGPAEVEAPGGNVLVPLRSRGDVVGVLCGVSAGGRASESQVRLLTSIARQIGIALENATLYEELERKEQVRAELLAKVIGAQEEERKRIARELHDEPSQVLSGVLLHLDKVERRLREQGGAASGDIEEVRQGARAAMESLARITTELRPQALDDLGFVPAIRWYAEQRLAHEGVQVDQEVVGRPDRLLPEIEVAVFRIMQEALNNVAKHAHATRVRIRLGFGESEVKGEIEDNGKGFSVQVAPDRSRDGAGLGLLGMQERAALLGGRLSVTSSPGVGTRVSFQIPLGGKEAQ